MAALSHVKGQVGVIMLKRHCIPLNIDPRASKCENNPWEIISNESFANAEFDL